VKDFMKNIVLLFLLTPMMSCVGEEVSVTIPQAIEMAFSSSERWEIQNNEEERAGSRYSEVKSKLYPHVNFDMTWMHNYQYPAIAQTKFTDSYYGNTGVSFTQVISTFGRIDAALSAAQKSQDLEAFRKESLCNEITFSTKAKYYQTNFTRRIFSIAEESYNRALDNKSILEERAEIGRVSKHDNIKILADVASRVPVMNDSRSSYDIAMEAFKKQIGVSDVSLDLSEGYLAEYHVLEKSSLYERLTESSPMIKILQKSIGIREDLVKGAKAEYSPTLSLFGNWRYRGGSDKVYLKSDSMYGYGEVGVTLQWPLITGGERCEKLRQVELDRSNALLELEKAYNDLFLELDQALTEYSERIKNIEANEQAVALAEKAFIMSQELFVSGQVSVADLNDAELMFTNQKIKREVNLFNINILLAKIEMVVGGGC
jgi:outer membrane protein